MAHFYGTLNGQAGEATRCGSARSGLKTVAAAWGGAVVVELSSRTRPDGSQYDHATVRFGDWANSRPNERCTNVLYSGPVNPTDAELLAAMGAPLVSALGVER